MKTAKEMFEKLGFKLKEDSGENFIEYETENLDGYVIFNLEHKDYTTDIYTVSIETHKAITQQMKELRWLR